MSGIYVNKQKVSPNDAIDVIPAIITQEIRGHQIAMTEHSPPSQ